MVRYKKYFILFCLIFSPALTAETLSRSFKPVESTIESLHLALMAQRSNCETITQQFLNRIQAYDQSTKLNAIILINPNAMKKARALDKAFKKTRTLRPLHCVPVILKDNFDTADMPTEAGSIAMQGSIPPDDAFMVTRLREAGAIIIAKSNMGEWAFSAFNTISSTHGETRNAYNLDYVPAGSSGGSASAIAASFGIIGMGSDTGNSIRGPASHLALVGLRSTLGLTSRDGVVPLVLNRDVAGGLTRTVEDTAKVLNVIAGYDPADPITHNVHARLNIDYTAYLKKNALQGVRLGVLRELYETDLADFEVMDLMDQAIKDLRSAGAIIVDPFEIENFKTLTRATGFCSRFRYDLNQYLSTLDLTSKHAPKIKRFQDLVDKSLFNIESTIDINWAAEVNIKPQDMQPPCIGVQGDPRRKQLLKAVISAMDKHKIDAIIYPTWSNPPRKIGDNTSPHGDNSPVIAPHTGQPAITLPMGFATDNLPAGLQFLGRPYDDARLIGYAYAYEQQTLHRHPPSQYPALE